MTKKFFNDWANKRSLTKQIKLNNSFSFEEKDKLYFVYGWQLHLDTLQFEGEYISIVANTQWYYTDKDGYGDITKRIKIHRKYINTVHFK
jgi:hypothetical protein